MKHTYVNKIDHRMDSEHQWLSQAVRTSSFQSCFITKQKQHLYRLDESLQPIAHSQPEAICQEQAARSQQQVTATKQQPTITQHQ